MNHYANGRELTQFSMVEEHLQMMRIAVGPIAISHASVFSFLPEFNEMISIDEEIHEKRCEDFCKEIKDIVIKEVKPCKLLEGRMQYRLPLFNLYHSHLAGSLEFEGSNELARLYAMDRKVLECIDLESEGEILKNIEITEL